MWRKGVLQKLVQFGIEGNMLLWIQDFLTGRKIQVKLGTVLSDLRDCLNGSPQGAVLSPILFNLIINTLYEALESLPIICHNLRMMEQYGNARTNLKQRSKYSSKL